jgi:hypothetical protein
MVTIAILGVMTLFVIVGFIRIFPDIVRYMKIRAM